MGRSSTQKLIDIWRGHDPNWFNAAVNISLRNKYVFISVPKVASSALKLHLHALELPDYVSLPGYVLDGKEGQEKGVRAHPHYVQSPFVKPFQLPRDLLEEVLFGDEYFKFTFVRDPFDRLLSGYLDKVKKELSEANQIFRVAAETLGVENHQDVTFEMFVDIVSDYPDFRRDRHWRTQSSLTLARYIDLDFVGKLENLGQHAKRIHSITGLDMDSIKNYAPHKTGAADKRLEFYQSAALIDKVAEIYAEDLSRFEYPGVESFPELPSTDPLVPNEVR